MNIVHRESIWGAHAPSRAGDGGIAIANFSSRRHNKDCFGEAPKPAREARALPRLIQ